MAISDLQHHAVDSIKRHALELALDSPRAQRAILTEYWWTEQGAESSALDRVTGSAPPWLYKLVTRQLADERRHAELLRARLAELGATTTRRPPALARAKLWWLERACAPYLGVFNAGAIVVVLAVAAQLEATGVRMFDRHLAVLERGDRDGATAWVLRSIVADERRHARSCALALERLVHDSERATLAALRGRIATIDRAFGITIAIGHWVVVAANAARDWRPS